MSLKSKLQLILKRPGKQDKAILRHEDVFVEHLKIGITKEDIVDKINAFDWLDIQEANTPEALGKVVLRLYGLFNIQCAPAFREIVLKAFTHKFTQATLYIKDGILNVHNSYNIEGNSKGFTNPVVDKFYYINYWADKKNIPVNYNEKSQERRDLFNMDTIILSILADKLERFNTFERNKPKK